MKNISKKLPVFILTCLLFFTALLAPLGGGKASAASDLANPPSSIDETNVLDDLEGSVLNGKVFNKDDFAQSDIRDPQIISFVEYGYSFYASRQDDYGLYVYIYNPRVQVFDNNSARNQIQFKAGELASDKYNLQFLDYSKEVGYEGLFYKYKVLLTETEKNQILSSLQRTERIYQVTEFELSIKGVLTSYTCATKYTYKGFAQGYGSELATEGTLTCSVDGFEDYIELNVHQTVYRPQGDFCEGIQSQLNSCYFRVPEKFFTEYGDLSKIVCEWFEYVTKPLLVTESNFIYQHFDALKGGNVDDISATIAFLIYSCGNVHTNWAGSFGTTLGYISNVKNFKNHYQWGILGEWAMDDMDIEPRYSNLAGVFKTADGVGYEKATVSGDDLQKKILEYSKAQGGPYYAGRYSQTLFTDYVNPNHIRGFNHAEITSDTVKDVFWNKTIKDTLQRIFGGYTQSTLYDTVKAIVQVDEEDLAGSDEEIAARLYISTQDVKDLKAEFAKAQNAKDGERLVLFRYGESDYYALPCTESYCNFSEDEPDFELAKDATEKWDDEEYTAYIAQETVYLDFDIISLWFRTEDAETEIPVAMTPQDVFSPISPPLEENYHTGSGLPDWALWLIVAVLVVLLIVVLVLFFPILRPIVAAVLKVLWWIITAPFRFIAWIIKKISAAVKKRKEEKAAAPPEPPDPPGPSKPKRGSEKAKGGKAQQEQRIILEIQRPPKAPQSKGGKNEKESHKTR